MVEKMAGKKVENLVGSMVAMMDEKRAALKGVKMAV